MKITFEQSYRKHPQLFVTELVVVECRVRDRLSRIISGWWHKVGVSLHIEYHSVWPIVRNGTPPHPLSPSRCVPPPEPKGGGGPTRLRVSGWGSQLGRLEKKPRILSTLWSGALHKWIDHRGNVSEYAYDVVPANYSNANNARLIHRELTPIPSLCLIFKCMQL